MGNGCCHSGTHLSGLRLCGYCLLRQVGASVGAHAQRQHWLLLQVLLQHCPVALHPLRCPHLKRSFQKQVSPSGSHALQTPIAERALSSRPFIGRLTLGQTSFWSERVPSTLPGIQQHERGSQSCPPGAGLIALTCAASAASRICACGCRLPSGLKVTVLGSWYEMAPPLYCSPDSTCSPKPSFSRRYVLHRYVVCTTQVCSTGYPKEAFCCCFGALCKDRVYQCPSEKAHGRDMAVLQSRRYMQHCLLEGKLPAK